MAAATQSATGVKPGSAWTFEQQSSADPCEVDYFGGSHQFAGDQQDGGTYYISGKTITMFWTSGNLYGGRFKGSFATGKYVGTLHGPIHLKIPAKLVKGALANC